MTRRMRVPPSGALITDGISGAGPLEVGDGTPGRVFRAQGIANAPNLLFTGAAQLLEWQDPAIAITFGPPITQLEWLLSPGYRWDIELFVPVRNVVAAANSALSVAITGRNVTSGLRENIFTPSVATTPDTSAGGGLYYDAHFRASRLELPTPGVYFDQLQALVTAPAIALFGVIIDNLSLRMTQYASGSY